MTDRLPVRRILRVLILEDEPDDASLIQRELDKSEIMFEAQVVDDKLTFISALNEFNPDIILSDYGLPSFSGLEALLVSQKISPGIPFVYVTGAIGEEVAAETIVNGAWGFVLKQNLSKLPSAIEDALNNSSKWVSWRLINTTKRVKDQINSNIEILSQINEFLKKGKLPDKKMSAKVEGSIDFLKEISKSHFDGKKNDEAKDK